MRSNTLTRVSNNPGAVQLHINKKLFLHFNEKGDIQRVDFIDQ